MSQVLVSVIMGTYNPDCEKLKKSVESIITQTYTNWELLLYDDGSEKNTAGNIRKIAETDQRIRYVCGGENRGLAYALNVCIVQAKGEYIARMDDDDEAFPERIEKQVAFLEENPEYSWTGCAAELIDTDGCWGIAMRPECPDKKAFLKYSPYIHPGVIFRRNVLKEANGYRDSMWTARCEDYELFMRLTASGHRGYNMQETLIRYREDSKYLKRRFRYCFSEMLIRIQGFYRLKLFGIQTIPYILKPIMVYVASRFPAAAQKIRRYKNKKRKTIR